MQQEGAKGAMPAVDRVIACVVERITRLPSNILVVHLRWPNGQEGLFQPGQYIEVLADDGTARPYSIANDTCHSDLLELHIGIGYRSAFIRRVFGQVTRGDQLRIRGPYGGGFLERASDKPTLYLAAGTGFAPVKGLIEFAFRSGGALETCLYWGAHSLRQLYMLEVPQQWQQLYKNFRFVPVLSESHGADSWAGRSGYVNKAVLEDYTSLAAYQVYACGPLAMLKSVFIDLTSRLALAEKDFHCDAW